jgi:excisionase family DNA binding protein
MEEQLLVSVGEAAHRMSIGLTVMYALISSGQIASIKIGRRRLIPVKALEDWIATKLAETASETA